jgi:hypothetical protein
MTRKSEAELQAEAEQDVLKRIGQIDRLTDRYERLKAEGKLAEPLPLMEAAEPEQK